MLEDILLHIIDDFFFEAKIKKLKEAYKTAAPLKKYTYYRVLKYCEVNIPYEF